MRKTVLVVTLALGGVLLFTSCRDRDEDERPRLVASSGRQAAPQAESAQAAKTAKIDAQQAIAAATAAVPGSAQEVRLDSRSGKPEYEVAVLPSGASSRVRVEVDATTGQVTKRENESSKDDDDDD
jgi:uncharacterized membrane protein YkoI